MPRYKKYQSIVRFYTPDLDISSQLRNLESIMIEDNIPQAEWVDILRKCLSSEFFKLLETVPFDNLQDYNYHKSRILQHYRLTCQGLKSMYHDLKLKSTSNLYRLCS